MTEPLLDWYRASHRPLPWRETRDPYAIWVSEIMLQQTRVETVAGYWGRFLARWPTPDALAAAPLDEVLKAWEGLGYYARCRNLHRAAGVVVRVHGGRVPADLEAVAALPGVGRSTAGAIVSIAYGIPAPVLDGNVRRVLVRLLEVREDPRQPAVVRKLWAEAEARARASSDPAGHTQAMMELGATVCLPRAPRCAACPWAPGCRARAAGSAADLPVRTPRKPLPHVDVGVGILEREGRLLIQRRPPEGLLGGLWEFPGGKREPGEDLRDTVRREFREELGLDVEVGEPVAVVNHAYTHFRVTLHAFRCRGEAGEPVPAAADAVAWVPLAGLDRYAFPRANRRILEVLTATTEGQEGPEGDQALRRAKAPRTSRAASPTHPHAKRSPKRR